ncbi:MAG: hypothetical protein GYA51_12730 [Candidatus Methanofastidiosa archaeon]|nr:hypothetical protein [Candidatus Methanofastidiosa archaeon]
MANEKFKQPFFKDNDFSNLKIFKVKTKEVFFVDYHQYVLPIWAYYSLTNRHRYTLVTFDYHTDTRQAFNLYAHKKTKEMYQFRRTEEFRNKFLQSIDSTSINSIISVTKLLANDEFIRAAMEFKYIIRPQVVTVEQTHNDYDIDYYNTENFFNLAPQQITPKPYEGDDRFLLAYRLNRLEDSYIKDTKFFIPKESFILDFDLDYFPTRESLHPHEKEIIRELIRKAQIITIAREKEYFKKTREQEGFSNEEAEKLLVELIDSCLD